MTEEPGLGKRKLLSSAVKKKNVSEVRFSGLTDFYHHFFLASFFKSRTFVHGQVIGLIAFDQILRLFS